MTAFFVAQSPIFHIGERVRVRRPGNEEWSEGTVLAACEWSLVVSADAWPLEVLVDPTDRHRIQHLAGAV